MWVARHTHSPTHSSSIRSIASITLGFGFFLLWTTKPQSVSFAFYSLRQTTTTSFYFHILSSFINDLYEVLSLKHTLNTPLIISHSLSLTVRIRLHLFLSLPLFLDLQLLPGNFPSKLPSPFCSLIMEFTLLNFRSLFNEFWTEWMVYGIFW